jgi:hypothetical protein
MTQPFTPPASDQTAPKHKRRTLSGVLVTRAAQEFIVRSFKLAEEREERAFNLLSCIAADMGDVEDAVIFCEHERIFCNLDEDDLVLEFLPGSTPQEDFFIIHKFMELPNLRPIRSLYDLGQAIDETGQLATQVLQNFRMTMLEASSWQDE